MKQRRKTFLTEKVKSSLSSHFASEEPKSFDSEVMKGRFKEII